MRVLDDVRLLGDEIETRARWRDLHAAGSHLCFSDGQSTRTAQIVLGQPTDEWPL